MVHNIDTLGATSTRACWAWSSSRGATLSFEVIPRRIDDRGGGLAKVAGRLRLLEGLAQPREDTEFKLRYYNTLTTWVRIDGLLDAFGLTRDDLEATTRRRSPPRSAPWRPACRRTSRSRTSSGAGGTARKMSIPVAQFEKLWGDLSSLPDLNCSFLAVDRRRGQQLKDAAQLDGWANDGSLDYVRSVCEFAR